MSKKIIVVFGATGAQGGGLVRAILNDKNSEFTVRAVTREVNSDKAKALAAMGAEVVSADIDSKESIAAALKGAYGAYFVTFFWAHFSPEQEANEVKNMAEAGKEAGIQHAIWSTLEDTRLMVPLTDDRMPTLRDKYKVPHFDAKGESDHFFTDAGVPTTFMLASYYWENMLYFGMGPKKGPDGKLYITFPMGDKKMAGIGAEDIGRCAYGIFKKGPSMAGRRVGIAGEQLTIAEMAQKLSKAMNLEIGYYEVTPEQYRGFGFPGADDLGNMFQIYRDFADECNKTRNVEFSKELNPQLQSFDMWLADNVAKMPMD